MFDTFSAGTSMFSPEFFSTHRVCLSHRFSCSFRHWLGLRLLKISPWHSALDFEIKEKQKENLFFPVPIRLTEKLFEGDHEGVSG